MNEIIGFTDIMSGSQLYNLPIAILQNVIEALTEDMFTVKSTMENKDFFRVIRKVECLINLVVIQVTDN